MRLRCDVILDGLVELLARLPASSQRAGPGVRLEKNDRHVGLDGADFGYERFEVLRTLGWDFSRYSHRYPADMQDDRPRLVKAGSITRSAKEDEVLTSGTGQFLG